MKPFSPPRSSSTAVEVDLTNCDREPIHIPGRIQAFGTLLAFSADMIVTHAAENLSEMAGRDIHDPVGSSLADIIAPDALERVRERLSSLIGLDGIDRLFRLALFEPSSLAEDSRLFDVALHASGRTFVMEIEPASQGLPTDHVGFIRPMIDRVQKAGSVENACAVAARQLRGLIGYDRVMIYRFGEDGSGEVVAESRASTVETSYLKLRYPASDIPQQARALYMRNLLRIIADVDGPTVDIGPPLGSRSQPLDLSLSTIRAVSPIHLEYLANMGVKASLSISLIVRGRLWGLVACHHYSPRVIPFDTRTAAELFGQLFAFAIDQSMGDARREEAARSRVVHDRIMASLADGTAIGDNFDAIADAVSTVIPNDGIAAWIDGAFTARGSTPTREEFLSLARFLNTTPVGEVFATDHIAGVHPPAADYCTRAAGMLVLPVSRKPRDYLVLFRREAIHDVIWAGNPDKPVEVGPNGVRLQPRKSFDAWTQTVHGRSKPWTQSQIGTAEALRVTLLEVVLRMSDQAVQERARAQEQQELLIAELNHRVRNILKLIQGLVTQSSTVADVASFTETVGGRIHALARAHDQITRENWNSSSLHDLIRTEAEAYFGEETSRVHIDGPDAMLAPNAFTTLSLVIHEMMTNAMKYGALYDRAGQVFISVDSTPKDDLRICWREEGGPAVTAPTRRGFGTTIIERSIPFELKGEARIHYEVTGVRGEFVVPAEHIDAIREPAPEAASDGTAPGPGTASLDGEVLIVEDNLIIALDAEDMLLGLGADQVHTAADVTGALAIVESRPLRFALLDINLGVETSMPVARALAARGVPFVLATGYGDRTAFADVFPDVGVVQKPYDAADVRAAIMGD